MPQGVSPDPEDPVASADREYREAVVDLLGAIAYGEISAFERLVEDAKLAPTLEDKVAIASMATAEFAHLGRLVDRLAGGVPAPGRGGGRSGGAGGGPVGGGGPVPGADRPLPRAHRARRLVRGA